MVTSVLPEQVFDPPHPAGRHEGELRLLWKILIDGIASYCRTSLRGARGREMAELEGWIFHCESEAITSFPQLCDLFAIDVRRLRRALLQLRQEEAGPEVRRILDLFATRSGWPLSCHSPLSSSARRSRSPSPTEDAVSLR